VVPSGCGVSDHVMVVNPAGNLACNISPLRRAGLTSGFSPLICSVIVDSFASTVSMIAQFPHGKVCIVPTQLPAKRLCFELGCCLAGFGAGSLASDLGLSLGGDFGFDFADCSGGRVGVDSSEIGAGSRCTLTVSRPATIRQRIATFISLMVWKVVR